MMKQRTMKLSLTVAAAVMAVAACQPAQLINDQSKGAPNAVVTQVQQAPVLAAGTVNGMVATYDGSKFVPVANAEIKVEGTSYVAHTDSEGRYTIAGMNPGSYTITANKDGMTSGSHEIVMNSVMGTPRVNLALQSPSRSLSAVPPAATVTVTGVVTDPRGSALPNANVRVVSNVGGAGNAGFNSNANPITSDAAGFYTVQIPTVSVSATQPGQVQVTSNGTSPGGVKLETTDVYAYTLTSTTLVANAQCKAFTQPGKPTFPNGSFGAMGTSAQIKSDWLSSRVDEFYVELYCAGSNGAVSQTYGVLPDSIAITAQNGQTPPNGVATFRIPFTMPGPSFQARVVPFGLASQFGKASVGGGNPADSSFVTNYVLGAVGTPGTFEDDVAASGAPVISDITNVANTINQGLRGGGPVMLGGDSINYVLKLENNNDSVSQDIQVSGTGLTGGSGITASYVPWLDNAAGTTVTVPAANITGPDANGAWSVKGVTLPVKKNGHKGYVVLTMNVTAPFALADSAVFGIPAPTLKMVSANLTKANNPSASNNLTVRNYVPGSFAITKTISDDGSSNGIGFINLAITPSSPNGAVGAIRITDRTYTNSPTGANALITGTTVLPAANTAIGFQTNDHLDIDPQDGANPFSVSCTSGMDLETLALFITALSSSTIAAQRDANNHLQLKRTKQGNINFKVLSTSSANVLTKLGITGDAGPTTVGTNGALADFTGVVGTMPHGSQWTLANGTTNKQEADGSVSVSFSLLPPLVFNAQDTAGSVITVSYPIKRTGGTIGLGGPLGNAGAVGQAGQGAPFGASITAVNTTPNNTDTTKDQAVGKTVADGTGTGTAL